MELKRSKNR